jgi:hypothetical protein
MAPLWQAWPIHRTADVYATSRRSAFGALVLKACLERMKASSPERRRARSRPQPREAGARSASLEGPPLVWLLVRPRNVSFPEWNCELR